MSSVRDVQTVMVTGPAATLSDWCRGHDTYPIHCPACGDVAVSTARGVAYLSTVLQLHMLGCGRPRVWRGKLQRAWWLRLAAGETVPVPSRHRAPGEPHLRANNKPSFYHLLARVQERDLAPTCVRLDDEEPERYGYRIGPPYFPEVMA